MSISLRRYPMFGDYNPLQFMTQHCLNLNPRPLVCMLQVYLPLRAALSILSKVVGILLIIAKKCKYEHNKKNPPGDGFFGEKA